MSAPSLAATRAFLGQERFKHITRPYTAEQVEPLQASVITQYASSTLALKLYDLLRTHQKNKTASTTFGSLDPVQVVQMAPYVDTIYVSGWQCASTASTTNEPGPDLADYPYTTVPNKVEQLFKAQEFHDRKQRAARASLTAAERQATPATDFFRPMIADADTGHGGLSAVMKLTKLFIEKGASGIHLEDQKAGTKKCGHLGGKVLVSVQEHIDRLVAARLQADVMMNNLVIVARTDAESARYLDSNADPRDHAWIVGRLVSPRHCPEGKDLAFPDAVKFLLEKEGLAAKFVATDYDTDIKTATARARHLLGAAADFTFDWEACRAREGYYRVKGCVEYGAARAIAFAPYADLVWLETAAPRLEEAKHFAEIVHKAVPHQLLAYNLSPSFNWDAPELHMNDDAIRDYTAQLAALGYVWQFITLAGFHVDGLAITQFARAYQQEKMLAYVRDVQREERKHKVALLKHQVWSGVEIVDQMIQLATAGASSTCATSEGITETQFGADHKKPVAQTNGGSHSPLQVI